jgi:hypothetical protein
MDVIGFFNLLNSSGRTMALRFNQPLTERSAGNIPGGVKRDRRVMLTTHRHSRAYCLENVRSSTSHNPTGLLSLLQG